MKKRADESVNLQLSESYISAGWFCKIQNDMECPVWSFASTNVSKCLWNNNDRILCGFAKASSFSVLYWFLAGTS